MCATSIIIFQVLPKVNNRPMGKNSPNLVTLLLVQQHAESQIVRLSQLSIFKYGKLWVNDTQFVRQIL
jgi:hypothetical protein